MHEIDTELYKIINLLIEINKFMVEISVQKKKPDEQDYQKWLRYNQQQFSNNQNLRINHQSGYRIR